VSHVATDGGFLFFAWREDLGNIWVMDVVTEDRGEQQKPVLGGFMPPTALATSGVGCVRFHGRNAVSWWKNGSLHRYDYRYRQRELVSWVPCVREIASHSEHTFVFFNNHRHGHALANAVTLSKLLPRNRKTTAASAKADVG